MIFIQDYINFPNNFDEFPTMRDLSAEEQQYINNNGVTAFLNEEKYTNKTATVDFNGTKQTISRVFMQAFHINWIVNMLKSLNDAGGLDGENSIFYYMSCPYQAITKTSANVYSPSVITVATNCLDGTTLSHPNFYFKFYSKSLLGDTWELKGSAGATSTYNIPISDIVDNTTDSIKIEMYNGNNELLDEKVLNILDMSPCSKIGYGNPTFYAQCYSSAAEDKTIILDDYIKYVNNTGVYKGIPIFVQFVNGNTNTRPVLRIYDTNNNQEPETSGYDIVPSNSENTNLIGEISPYAICMLIYDGDNWQMINYH